MDNQPETPSTEPSNIQNTQPTVMSQPKRSFAWLTWLLILLIVVVGAGVYAWQHSKVTDLQTKLTSAKSTPTKTATGTTNSTTASATPYLYLYDYGLKVPLTTDIQDLYYVDSKETNDNVLSFSTQALANADPGCVALPFGVNGGFLDYSYSTEAEGGDSQPAGGSPFGYVQIQKTALPADKVGSLDDQVGTLVAHSNGYYLYYKAPQAACGTNDAADKLVVSQREAVVNALKKVKPID